MPSWIISFRLIAYAYIHLLTLWKAAHHPKQEIAIMIWQGQSFRVPEEYAGQSQLTTPLTPHKYIWKNKYIYVHTYTYDQLLAARVSVNWKPMLIFNKYNLEVSGSRLPYCYKAHTLQRTNLWANLMSLALARKLLTFFHLPCKMYIIHTCTCM